MVFVDTGAWFALHVPTDPNHQRAVDWLQDNEEPLVTTDFVIDEILTLLLVRQERRRALEVGRLLIESGSIQVHFLSPEDFHRAWILFQRYHAAGWSFNILAAVLSISSYCCRGMKSISFRTIVSDFTPSASALKFVTTRCRSTGSATCRMSSVLT